MNEMQTAANAFPAFCVSERRVSQSCWAAWLDRDKLPGAGVGGIVKMRTFDYLTVKRLPNSLGTLLVK